MIYHCNVDCWVEFSGKMRVKSNLVGLVQFLQPHWPEKYRRRAPAPISNRVGLTAASHWSMPIGQPEVVIDDLVAKVGIISEGGEVCLRREDCILEPSFEARHQCILSKHVVGAKIARKHEPIRSPVYHNAVQRGA